jgi:hypothetical protein
MKTTFLFLFLNHLALGQNFYVAPTGNNSNAGTLAAPWKTIPHAADVATPGSTVLSRLL